MGTVTILPYTTKNPISMIGEMAGVCWGADTSDPAKNYRRGWDCIESGHGRTMEFPDVYMMLDGYSARVIREWYTHIGGMPTRLQASTRYIDYGDFEYVTPPSLMEDGNESLLNEYKRYMVGIGQCVAFLEMHGIPREDAALLLPLGMTTRIVDKRNLRNLIDMSRQRMCNRAYWEFREMFRDICIALTNYSEEWGRLVNTQFHAKCAETRTCPEKHGCGKYSGRAT
jgi:thymidylate synthase (FAD)